MPTASWNGTVIAESANTEVVEGNHYFPPDSLKMEFFEDSTTTSNCPWKGIANYYTVVVADERNRDAAWTYRDPKEAAANIKEYVAFWRGVSVEE